MRLLIQVVNNASVEVENKTIGQIDYGYLVFAGICDDDNEDIADKMIKKLIDLRIFPDNNGKTNLSLNDINGSILFVSQFTLYADCRKGNRPSFTNAGSPIHANELYEYMINQIDKQYNINVQTGKFGADMKVSLVNNGPFTIMLDSEEIIK